MLLQEANILSDGDGVLAHRLSLTRENMGRNMRYVSSENRRGTEIKTNSESLRDTYHELQYCPETQLQGNYAKEVQRKWTKKVFSRFREQFPKTWPRLKLSDSTYGFIKPKIVRRRTWFVLYTGVFLQLPTASVNFKGMTYVLCGGI